MFKPFFIILLMTFQNTFSQSPTNYLNVDSLSFLNESFELAWTKTDGTRFVQEYLRDGDSLSSFNKMILLDALISNDSLIHLVRAKTLEVEGRKEKDPVANYRTLENKEKNEYLLDFLISNDRVYEWNAYRYVNINTKKGKAILVFAYSIRSYSGSEIPPNDFFKYLKSEREKIIEYILNYPIPKISINN